ncbi:hypothetical protein Q8F55_008765 [Vanrija albida]|uniref:Sel1 repeat family protein n=1 Tax=Vanrija albida TaxID=181172 RepID=A0ABR3PRQ4_9TREE
MGCCSSKNAAMLDDNEKTGDDASAKMAAILGASFASATGETAQPKPTLQPHTLEDGRRALANEQHPSPWLNGLAVEADPNASPELNYLAAKELVDGFARGDIEIGITPGNGGPLLAEKLALRASLAGQHEANVLIARVNNSGNYFGTLHPDDVSFGFRALEAGVSAGDRACAVKFIQDAQYLQPGLLEPYDEVMTKAQAAKVLDGLLASGDKDPQLPLLKAYMLQNGNGYLRDEAAARQWAQLAADAGSVDAEFELYIYWAQGIGGPADAAESHRHLVAAAKGGHARSMANLGGAYATGAGVPKDEALSLEWYKKAADAGLARAAHVLSVMYRTGEGAPRDPVLAEKYEKMADGLA